MKSFTCDHCGGTGTATPVCETLSDGIERKFCCHGCAAVARLIHEDGLDAFYRFRDKPLQRPELLDEGERASYQLYADPDIQIRLSRPGSSPGTREIELIIRGITCAACTWLIEQHLKKLSGVEEVWVNGTTHRALVQWHPDQITLADLLLGLRALGYEALPYSPAEAEKQAAENRRQQLFRMGLAGIGAMQNMMLAVPTYFALQPDESFYDLFRWLGLLITLPVLLYSARPFYVNALRDLRARHLTMDVPVALALTLAFGASTWVLFSGGTHTYFDSVCMFTFFLLVSKSIEQGIQHRALVTLNEVAHQPPRYIEVLDSPSRWKAVDQLVPGDHIRVPAGAAVPVDGVALSEGQIDEAMMTGEFLPREITAGEQVLAGSLVCHTALTLEVTRERDESQLAVLEQLAARAQSGKTRMVRMADRVAALFVGRLLILTVLVGAGWLWYDPTRAFDVILSLLVITCPCALSLSIPAAQSAGLASLRRAGVLIVKPDALDRLPEIRVAAFDKTGTLTHGRFSCTAIHCLAPDITENMALSHAAALEAHSSHPAARAFAGACSDTSPPFDQVRVWPSAGVEGWLDGDCYRIGSPDFTLDDPAMVSGYGDGLPIVLSRNRQPLAVFVLSDALRDDAVDTLATLRSRHHLKTVLLTGDGSTHARQLARQLPLDEARFGLSPEDKLETVARLRRAHGPVLMVGDGLNDAPVLSGADVSVAMSEGADLAKVSADCLLLTHSLSRVTRLVDTAFRIRRTARQNIAWAIGYNVMAIPVAALGWVTPWIAALGMSLSSLVVVINASRLSRLKE